MSQVAGAIDIRKLGKFNRSHRITGDHAISEFPEKPPAPTQHSDGS